DESTGAGPGHHDLPVGLDDHAMSATPTRNAYREGGHYFTRILPVRSEGGVQGAVGVEARQGEEGAAVGFVPSHQDDLAVIAGPGLGVQGRSRTIRVPPTVTELAGKVRGRDAAAPEGGVEAATGVVAHDSEHLGGSGVALAGVVAPCRQDLAVGLD